MAKYDTAWWMANPDHMTNERNGQNAAAYEAQEDAVAGVIENAYRDIGKVPSVLEVGCGFGRITKIVRDVFKPKEYVATDVSADALAEAATYLPDGVGPGFRPADLDAWPKALDEKFDLVIAAEVLMHRPPEKVGADARLLASLANKYILTVDWHEDSNRYAEGCYQHDYRALFAPFGTVEETPVRTARQAVYLVKLERDGLREPTAEDEARLDAKFGPEQFLDTTKLEATLAGTEASDGQDR